MLKERGIYTIARMVVMKDNTSAAARPELAVRNNATGEPWRDNIGGAWLDPSAPGVAEYIASIAGDLADKGFDEVQLDYIRFYSDGPYDLADTNLPNTQSFRLPAIQRVLRVVSSELETSRAFLGADVFPISFIVPDDQGIGQRPEVIMPYVDYFCPMVYPSHYGPGVFGHPVPNTAPYDVIDKTLEIMNKQKDGLAVVIRPWIQDFGYGQFPPYTADQVLAEMAAARRQRRPWLDDLERPRDLHRGGPRRAARGRGLRVGWSSSHRNRRLRPRRNLQPRHPPRPRPMRLVVQRVTRASVREGDQVLGEIGLGAVVLAGIGTDDDAATIDRMADKLVGLRYFRDADGRTNLAIADVGGGFLVVSQFTSGFRATITGTGMSPDSGADFVLTWGGEPVFIGHLADEAGNVMFTDSGACTSLWIPR